MMVAGQWTAGGEPGERALDRARVTLYNSDGKPQF